MHKNPFIYLLLFLRLLENESADSVVNFGVFSEFFRKTRDRVQKLLLLLRKTPVRIPSAFVRFERLFLNWCCVLERARWLECSSHQQFPSPLDRIIPIFKHRHPFEFPRCTDRSQSRDTLKLETTLLIAQTLSMILNMRNFRIWEVNTPWAGLTLVKYSLSANS